MLERNLKMSLPEILRGEASHFFNLPPPPHAGDMVLFVYINFAFKQRDITRLYRHVDGYAVAGGAEDIAGRIHRPNRWQAISRMPCV